MMRPPRASEVRLTDDERHTRFDPAETRSKRGRLLCELEAGHAGPHWSLGDNADEAEDRAGLRWTGDGTLRELVEQVGFRPELGVRLKDGDPQRLCTLPLGHHGLHCFSLDTLDYGDDVH